MGGHIFEILVMLIIAAILGFLIAWFWRKKKIVELEVYIRTLEEKNNQLQVQLNDNEKLLLDCQADKKKLGANNERLEKLLANCNIEKGKFELEKNETAELLIASQTDGKKLEDEKVKLEKQLEDCLAEKNKFENENGELILSVSGLQKDNKSIDAEKTELNSKLNDSLDFNKKLETDKKDIEKLLVECQGNLMTSGVKLFNKEIDGEECAEELEEVKKEVAPVPKKTLSKQEEALERVKAKAEKIDFSRIGTANENEKDDLKIIKGIGPFIEKKLNALGIFRFEQIANLNDEDKDLVNDAIEFFPGRVKRDDWVGQSIELAKS